MDQFVTAKAPLLEGRTLRFHNEAISVVIVTWNAKDYTRQCLTSLRMASSRVRLETIVVDNASSDGTVDMIVEEFPEVSVIQNASNVGFAKANNIGILKSTGKYVFLVNSDVIVLNGCIESIVEYMNANTDIAMLGPKMIGPNGVVRRSTMRFPTLWNSLCCSLGLNSLFRGSRLFDGFEMSDFNHDETVDVDVLNGWFWVVRRDVALRVGLLDERFFMYGEDIDWCYRFHQEGVRVVFYPGAAATHFGGASSSIAPSRFYVEMYRANVQFWKKNYGSPMALGYMFTLWIHAIVRLLGYSVVFLFYRESRPKAVIKLDRSLSVLRWLASLRSVQD